MSWLKSEGKHDQWNGSYAYEQVRFARTEQWQITAFAYGLCGRSDDPAGCGSAEGNLYKKLAGVLADEVRRLREEIEVLKSERKESRV